MSGVARAISGTSTSAPRPAARAARDAIGIDGRLAAGGVAIEQHRLLPALLDGRANDRGGRSLFRVELAPERTAAAHRLRPSGEGAPDLRAHLQLQQPPLGQPADSR